MILEYSSGEIAAQLAHSRKILVKNVSFALSAGETLALIGETGSGKTMTALSIMGLLPENVTMENGCISFLGEIITEKKDMRSLLGDQVVYIPQNGLEFLNPSRKIRHHLYDNLKRIGTPRKKLEQTAKEAKPEGMTREESFAYYQSCEPKDMFDVKPVRAPLPVEAKIFDSYTCACCGEVTGANWIRIQNGKKVCLDCFDQYDRFDV